MRKIVKHLSYAETASANTSGNEMPQVIGKIFKLPDYYSVYGQRLALLLNEDQIKISESERLIIVLSTYLKEGTIEASNRSNHKEATYLNIGVDASKFEKLSDKEKINDLLDLTALVLLYYAESEEDKAKISQSIERLKQEGEKIELPYQSKEDQSIVAFVTMTIQNDGRCQLYLTIKNQSDASVLLKKNLRNTHCFSVADQLCGTLLLRKSKVIIKPQKNIGSKNFEPIEVAF